MSETLQIMIILAFYLLLFLVPYRVATRMTRRRTEVNESSPLAAMVVRDFFAGNVTDIKAYSTNAVTFSHTYCSVYINILDKKMSMLLSDEIMSEHLSNRSHRRFLKYLNENQRLERSKNEKP